MVDMDAQERADACFRAEADWARRSLICASRCGGFSSDRMVKQYAQNVLRLEPIPPIAK